MTDSEPSPSSSPPPHETDEILEPGLEAVYAAQTPAESLRAYQSWAATYDTEFRPGHGYIYNDEVVAGFVQSFGAQGTEEAVIDVGCGTGAVGESLSQRGVWTVDGVDLSPEMLALAAAKVDANGRPLYRRLIEADLTAPNSPIAPGSYAAAVSSGLFTHGHVGPSAIATMAAMVRGGGLLCFGVNEQFYEAANFDEALAELEATGVIGQVEQSEIRVYDATAQHDYADVKAKLVQARVQS